MLRPRAVVLALTLVAFGAVTAGASEAEARARAASSAKKRAKPAGAKAPARAEKKADKAASKKGAKPAAAGKKKRNGRTASRSEAQASTPRRAATLSILPGVILCPEDMVAVAGRVCVDRFETSLVDRDTGAGWSPFYTPDAERVLAVRRFYDELRGRTPPAALASLMPLPPAPHGAIEPASISVGGAIPQGYLSADQADVACRNVGKRLCSESEWLTACRGEAQRDFPYGDRYVHGACNVYRESHPTALLHGNAARYHDDPRNGLVTVAGRTLAQPTGSSAACASRWGDDAVFDMVGNLDEWVADTGGVFVGGFYSRANRSGCFARVSNHPRAYSDYSTGTRCCKDPALEG